MIALLERGRTSQQRSGGLIKKGLLRIASDGKLDHGEEEELKKIVACLSDFADDVMELRMYLKKHGGTPDGTN